MTRPAHLLLSALAALVLSSCAGVSFDRDSSTSGNFVSSGLALTVLSFDFPKSAVNIARENASDARQPNMVVHETTVFPYLGPLDILLDIIGVRYARVTGTWGFKPDA